MITVSRQTTSSRDPARMPAHNLYDKHLGRGFSHGTHIEGGLTGGYRDIFRHRTKAGAGVGDGQIIVHRLGYVYGTDWEIHLLG